jgi:hypothetical protein
MDQGACGADFEAHSAYLDHLSAASRATTSGVSLILARVVSPEAQTMDGRLNLTE